MSSECNQFRAEGQPCSGWDAMRTHIQELEIKLNDAEYDRDRWHKAFLDAKYPEMLPTRVDLEARIADLEAQLLKSSPEHQAQMKWARDVVRQVVIPPAESQRCDCISLSVHGVPGDFEVYCPKCGKIFRASDTTHDWGGEL